MAKRKRRTQSQPAPTSGPLEFLAPVIEEPVDALLTGLGAKEQSPGDLSDFIGAAVSLYPPKMLKDMASNVLRRMKIGPGVYPGHVRAIGQMAQLYPRVFGHLDEVKIGPVPPIMPGHTTSGQHTYRFNKLEGGQWGDWDQVGKEATNTALKVGNLEVDPIGARAVHKDFREVAGHELTHAAQKLGRKGFWKEYGRYNLDPTGNYDYNLYKRNPFELGADRGGEKIRRLTELMDYGFSPADAKRLYRMESTGKVVRTVTPDEFRQNPAAPTFIPNAPASPLQTDPTDIVHRQSPARYPRAMDRVKRRDKSMAEFDAALDSYYSQPAGNWLMGKNARSQAVEDAYQQVANPAAQKGFQEAVQTSKSMRPKPVSRDLTLESAQKSVDTVSALKKVGYEPTEEELSTIMQVGGANPRNYLSALKGQFPPKSKIRQYLTSNQFIKEFHALAPVKPSGGNQSGSRLKRPADPRASGMLPGENPDLRDPERVLPAFRSRAGMATDVLQEMKNTPTAPNPYEARIYKAITGDDLEDSVLGEFEFNAGKRKTPTLLYGKEGENIYRYNDPVTYIGNMKSMDDEMLASLPGSSPKQAENLFNSGAVDQVIDDLAEFFSTGKYDPFGPSIRAPFKEANRTTHITERANPQLEPTPGIMDELERNVNNLFTEGAPIEGVDASLMKFDIDQLHKGQDFKGGLYNWLGDVTPSENDAFLKYLKRIGFDPETTAFTNLAGDVQKAIVDSWRASRPSRRKP